MRIVVFGSGGVGGYFGARLVEAGEDVVFVARGAHLEAIRTNGLKLHSINGDVHLPEVTATDSVDESFDPDLVLVCVKTWQVDEAAAAIRPMLGDATVVLPLLNGVEANDQLGVALGTECIVGGLCRIIAYIEAPGVIRHAAVDPFIGFGELNSRHNGRANLILSVFSQARGVRIAESRDIDTDLWMKFLLIAPTGGIGTITRTPMGIYRSDPGARRMLEQATREVYAVGVASGVALADDAVEKTLRMVDALPASITSSMQRDIMSGRPSELDAQIGVVVRMGAALGVDTPLHDFLYASLLPSEKNARGELDYTC